MGTVITIIIVIISVVFKLLAENLKENNTPTPTPSAPPVNSLEEILRRVREQQAAQRQQAEQDEEEQAEVPAYKPEVVRQAPQQAVAANSFVEAYQSPAMMPQQYDIPQEGVSAVQHHTNIEVQEIADDNVPFDLRQAVIYSAILNRPQF